MKRLRRLATIGLVLVVSACAGTAPSQSSGTGPSRTATADATTVPSSPPATPASTPSPPMALALVGPGEPWIVFVWGIEGGVGNRLVRADGTDDHAATPDVPLPPEGWQIFPDWSPDSQRLAFTADDATAVADNSSGTRDLWIATVGERDAVKALDCVLPCQEYSWPAWSPDGREIAYTTFDLIDGVADGSRLMALDVASGTTRELSRTNGPEYLVAPRWSPDGRSLVVGIDRWSDTGTNSTQTGKAIAIVDLDADSPAPRRLTDWDRWAYYPDWHPSKDLIVFADRPWTDFETGPSNLYTVRPDGSGMTALTHFEAPGERAVQPTWTPDGASIIFTRVSGTGFGEPTMALIDADGTNLRPATGADWMPGTHARMRPTVGP